MGADVVIHSLTKFINGASDTVGGVICASKEFIHSLIDVNTGASMLLGPTMDALRANSILKNMRTLHVRMKQHSQNAKYLSEQFQELGLRVSYPGLDNHPQHKLMKATMNQEFGFGGMLMVDAGSMKKAYELMEAMQHANIGYLAVSLGFYKTLFSAPGASTSSEIPLEDQDAMGLSDGMVRMSVGLDNDIERTLEKIKACMEKTSVLPTSIPVT
jgi:methionine-gamma-lyase